MHFYIKPNRNHFERKHILKLIYRKSKGFHTKNILYIKNCQFIKLLRLRLGAIPDAGGNKTLTEVVFYTDPMIKTSKIETYAEISIEILLHNSTNYFI